MKLLVIAFILYPFFTYGWFPMRDTQELRVIYQTKDYFRSYDIEGQILNKNLIGESTYLGVIFKMNKESSQVGGHLTYKVNDYSTVTVNTSISNKSDVSYSFVVSGIIYPIKNFEIFPFLTFDAVGLGHVGAIIYFYAYVWSHIGLSYNPRNKQIALMFGTSFNVSSDLLKTSLAPSEILEGATND